MKDTKNSLVTLVLMAALTVGAYTLGLYKARYEALSAGVSPTAAEAQGAGGTVDDAAPPEEITELTDADWKSIQENPAFVMGSSDAKVTMVEYTDYQCPYCARYNEQTFNQIKKDYVDTGKVRYMIRDLPLSFHANAEDAAVAVRCAGQQGKYLEMHDKVFAGQVTWGELEDAKPTFGTYASQLAMDQGKFKACQADEKIVQAVKDDLSLATKVGASGTPTFFVNGKVLVGAQPIGAFTTMIDGALE